MSAPLSTFEWWETGTTQPSIPVNNNALRTMIGMRAAVSDSVTSQPALTTPNDDGLWYVIPSGATGDDWATFDENSCAIFFGGNWYEFVPEDGDIISINCALYCFTPSNGWGAISGGGGGGGDVSGPGSSTDNALVRWDGSDGDEIQNSGIIITDSDEISGYRGNVRLETGTTYTLDVAGTDTDSGRIIDHANGSGITVTLPNSAPVGFCVTYVQSGAGQVTFSAASGATLQNRQSHTKIAGQWGMVTLYVRANSGGTSAVYVLGGDTAA